jgi:hypothetical protein
MIDRSRLPNAFEFVALAGARARQLMNGCLPRVGGARSAARIAQLEVLSGAVQKAAPTGRAEPPAAEAASSAEPS